jgi:hypothetical protein
MENLDLIILTIIVVIVYGIFAVGFIKGIATKDKEIL